MPTVDAIDRSGLEDKISEENIRELLSVDTEGWLKECDMTEEYYKKFGTKLPEELTSQLSALRSRLEK